MRGKEVKQKREEGETGHKRGKRVEGKEKENKIFFFRKY